jgi:hypothetical protein
MNVSDAETFPVMYIQFSKGMLKTGVLPALQGNTILIIEVIFI